MAFTMVTIVNDYDLADGLDPSTGSVSFTPVEPMVNGTTVVSAPVSTQPDVDGLISIRIVATTNPGTTTPSGAPAAYLVEETIDGTTRHFSVSIPYDAGDTLSLSDLTQTPVYGFPATRAT